MKTARARSPPPPVLPDEVIYEILPWLPAKTLLRFRCVCNSWKSLISDPKFVKLHLHRSSKNTNLLFTSTDSKSERSALSCSVRSLLLNPSSTAITEDLGYRLDLWDDDWVSVSCNGLVCLVYRVWGVGFKKYWVRLWNPVTRLITEKSPCLLVGVRGRQLTFADFGLGYDNLTDTYKVVAVSMDMESKEKEDSERTLVSVYSFDDNCWRRIQSFPILPFPKDTDNKFLNGTFNWLACSKRDAFTINQWEIVSLDLGKETYKQLLLPTGFDEFRYVVPNLGVLMDCLCLACDHKGHFVVWQMTEFGIEKSWTQLVKVSYVDLQVDCLEMHFSTLLPLCMSEDGDVLIIANHKESQGILYNRRDNRVERTKICDDISWIHAHAYVQSLVSTCGMEPLYDDVLI